VTNVIEMPEPRRRRSVRRDAKVIDLAAARNDREDRAYEDEMISIGAQIRAMLDRVDAIETTRLERQSAAKVRLGGPNTLS
jgi:hypothetical protein